jgi:hypothetical protein
MFAASSWGAVDAGDRCAPMRSIRACTPVKPFGALPRQGT